MAEKILVVLQGGCPRCNQGVKKVLVDPDDPMHTRECPSCQYAWSPMVPGPDGPKLREGAGTYKGEFAAPEPEPAPEPVAAAETGGSGEADGRRRRRE